MRETIFIRKQYVLSFFNEKFKICISFHFDILNILFRIKADVTVHLKQYFMHERFLVKMVLYHTLIDV